MGKCTEGAPRAIARVLNVITLCRLVNLWVELLLSPAKLEFRWLAGARLYLGVAVFGRRRHTWCGSTGNCLLYHSSRGPPTRRQSSPPGRGCCGTCTFVGCVSGPCCCGTGDTHTPACITSVAFCTALSCNWQEHKWCPATLGRRSAGFSPCPGCWDRTCSPPRAPASPSAPCNGKDHQ